MLNKTDKRVITMKLNKLRKDWGGVADRANACPHRTQKEIKYATRQAYRVQKAVDFLLQNL